MMSDNEKREGMITEVPKPDSSGAGEDTGPRFEEPEGGYDRGTTQPDYGTFAREAARVALNTNGQGPTGELGDSLRDDQGRMPKFRANNNLP